MWLNYLPIAGEGLYVHHWIIRRAQSSDLAGFKVTIALSYSWGSSCQEVFLTHVQFSLSERFIFEEANKAVFMEGVAVFFVCECFFSPFSDAVLHHFLPTWHRWGGLQQHIKALGLRCWQTPFLCFFGEIAVSVYSPHLSNSSCRERSTLAYLVLFWSPFQFKASDCYTAIHT